MVVRRRKSLGGRIVTPVHLNLLGHKDCGVGLESGVFVASVVPGSPAAREGSLTAGDRLIAINGIALDNKSLSECESLLRNCHDSLSLSLMKFFPQSCSGQNLYESLRDAERSSNCRLHASERPVFSERCYDKRPFTFDPAAADCVTVETTLDKGHAQKHSGGTWPKMVVGGGSGAEPGAHLSIFKVPKQRKSIFDAEAFKRPDTPSKLDYRPAHSPQASAAEVTQAPPTPPTRSDSFKFKHKQQSSSASDSTVTAGSPPPTPAPGAKPDAVVLETGRDRNGNHYFLEGGADCKGLSGRKSCEEDLSRRGGTSPR
ncbi:hypothetical protein ANANG_G00052270 [Anguilla anguilla]|uniref:PDZ domain-containing protein n=1 Tax=Anguilla anguilla TaxID=7936 RepID=A0A9D3S5Q1_ANGAN|nr:hypothetical protein ANANG_G00052270 [Anguilla anguilla]